MWENHGEMIRLNRGNWPIHLLIALSCAGWLFLESDRAAAGILSDRWSPAYWLLAPFFHGALWHFLLNALTLNFLGEPLLRILGPRRFLGLFAACACGGNLANNLFGQNPAVGISGAVLGILACMTYPHGRAPVKFLVIHDLLRLPPFPLWKVAAGLALLDVAGILLGWEVFAHWGHLGGFASGMGMGWLYFRRPPDIPPLFPRRREWR